MATSKQVFAALLAYDAFIERCDGDPNTGARLEAMRLALEASETCEADLTPVNKDLS